MSTAGRGAVLALDQGTSGTKGLLVTEDGRVSATAHRPLTQQYPAPGWVEQDPAVLWRGVTAVAGELAARAAATGTRVTGLGLSVQREAVLVWDRDTGAALSPLVSWQDRRTAERCAGLAASAEAELISDRTGLPVDPMFSATKAEWLLDRVDPRRELATTGRLRVGTVDAWLLHRLTGGLTDATETGCASRTQLVRLDDAGWDPELLDLFRIPRAALPRIAASDGAGEELGHTRDVPGLADGLPIAAVLGDSHAALFAQSHGRPGTVKATYGTGASLMVLNPDGRRPAGGIAATLAWRRTRDTGAARALEANIASAGTAIHWAAQLLGTDPAGIAALAAGAREDAEVYLVPAFSGLGAPYWDRGARALLVGMDFDTGPAEVARAAVESMAYQVADTLSRFDTVLGGPVGELRADGGPTGNDRLMALQAELIGRPVRRSGRPEVSALGAAHLAGTALGLWNDADLPALTPRGTRFTASGDDAPRDRRMAGWRDAVACARGKPA
ncbi:FGGY-family carbohydrate kinase [Streptomyces zingiberis]|uniref:ATP:glycerol 3-phosphotransferase n=1 Tax=Streptomyces zingiberis TaxID=2053010 RepID=A0ABX1BWK4_9ACTN|nr:FGGY family carbohydrate kinase [Streptomyces zingiberis]NJQ02031.1 glycerol kinase [Streptomyces zingiberis]